MKSTLIILLAIVTYAMCHWAQLEPEMMLKKDFNRMPSDDFSMEFPYRIPVDDFTTERSITGYVGGRDKYDEIAFSVSPQFANTTAAQLSIFPLVWGCPSYRNKYIDLAVIGPCDGDKFVPLTEKQVKKYPFKGTVDVNTQCFYLLEQEKGDNRGILNEPVTNNTFLYPNDINSACIRTRPAPQCAGMHNVIYRYPIRKPGNYRVVYWEKKNNKVDYSIAFGVRSSGRSALPEHQLYTWIIGQAYSVLTFNNKRARVRCPYDQISTEWTTYLDPANQPDLSGCAEGH